MSEVEMLDGHPVPLGFGPVDLAVIRQVSGLELLRGMRDGLYPVPTISRTLGFRMRELDEGIAEFTGVPNENYMNPMNTVHGGYMAAILDSALGCAVHTLCPAGFASTSIELKINFVRPITAATGRVSVRGEVVHPGRQIATSEGRLVDEQGKLFAHGTSTCSIFRLPEQA